MHETFFKSDMKSRVDDALAQEREDAAIWRAVCRVVDARDGRECRACGKRTNPDAIGLLRGHRHHMVYRSAGGKDTSENLVTLCAADHDAEHRSRLRIAVLDREHGADGPLQFWSLNAGEWFVTREETAPCVVRRD